MRAVRDCNDTLVMFDPRDESDWLIDDWLIPLCETNIKHHTAHEDTLKKVIQTLESYHLNRWVLFNYCDICSVIAYKLHDEYIYVTSFLSVIPNIGCGTRVINRVKALATTRNIPINLVSSDDALDYYKRKGFIQVNDNMNDLTWHPNQ